MKLEYLKKCNICARPTKYDFWMEDEKAWDLMWLRRLKKIRKYKKSGTLLDIGGGIGQFLYFAKDYFRIKGTEVSKSAIKTAKQKYNVELIPGQIEDKDFKDLRFDLITLFHVLEHVPNPSVVIKKCRKLLKKEGIIIVAVPNDIYSLRAIARSLLATFKIGGFRNRGKFGLHRIAFDGSIDEIHLSHFTSRSLETLFAENGFTIVETSLDPYYIIKKYKKIIDHLFYFACLFIKKIFRVNIYDTIWIVTRAADRKTIYNKNYFKGDLHTFSSIERASLYFEPIVHSLNSFIKPSRVLDVGCAKGFLVSLFHSLGVNTYGLDISSYAINRAPEEIRKNLSVSDVEEDNLPFYGKVGDIIRETFWLSDYFFFHNRTYFDKRIILFKKL